MSRSKITGIIYIHTGMNEWRERASEREREREKTEGNMKHEETVTAQSSLSLV